MADGNNGPCEYNKSVAFIRLILEIERDTFSCRKSWGILEKFNEDFLLHFVYFFFFDKYEIRIFFPPYLIFRLLLYFRHESLVLQGLVKQESVDFGLFMRFPLLSMILVWSLYIIFSMVLYCFVHL